MPPLCSGLLPFKYFLNYSNLVKLQNELDSIRFLIFLDNLVHVLIVVSNKYQSMMRMMLLAQFAIFSLQIL